MFTHFLGHPIRLALSTLKITCLAHLGFTHLLQVSPAEGPSMLPTFALDGDWIAADMRHRLGRGVAVGDLVLYKIPISANDNGVKRVVGMPGDYVSLGTPGEKGEDQMIQVPEGHCWIAGDNLPASRDSRQFGPLPLALVQAKVVAKVLPWKERQWVASGLQPLRVD
ncbi:hypothetical protein C2857_000619 [Epichloe festucae Fl1]|uniref:Peptidase S26 domain-containing protein n=1 Tax=Epichloe festucae (strain Fl1) TaxID=877507 RepID=A0A7S9KU11_EPIFF|nr:hypothetical protein C2857_000619 [Epichloe festucae Fl1]